jgi:hypothetical protein
MSWNYPDCPDWMHITDMPVKPSDNFGNREKEKRKELNQGEKQGDILVETEGEK